MPLVRSTGNIPADIEQEVASAALNVDEAAGWDIQIPVNPIGRPRTRLQTRRDNNERENVDNDQIRRIIDNSLSNFRNEMINMIADGFRDMSLANQAPVVHDTPNQIEPQATDHSERDDRTSRNHPSDRENRETRRSNRDLDRNSEKVLNIIRNWKVRFTGISSEITVDEFIYRINTLTIANLGGDFNLLMEHAHILYENKAIMCFWRFHRSCVDMDWDKLCDAIKRQYKDDKTDFDIRDDMIRRKQKLNETFDEYYDSMMVLSDKLRTPLSEYELCETLQRNLRPEVRHEILHLEISRVSHLRRAVQRHEKFYKDMAFVNSSKRRYPLTQVTEIVEDTQTYEKEEENDSEICLLVRARKCWNCDKDGHSFIDCMEPRTIFCYGCGAKNIFKPNCPDCLKKRGNMLKDVRTRKDGHPKQN